MINSTFPEISDSASYPGKSVLIVEDGAIVAIHLRNTICSLGYNVVGPVATGEAALKAMVEQKPDLVLMDIQLPGDLDGIGTAERMRTLKDIPIIFLTSYSQDSLIKKAKATIPYGYLLKPVSPREMAATIELAFYRHDLDIELKKSREALERANENLEQKVLNRTLDLSASNRRLSMEIEGHRLAEIALHESEERYRRITEGLTDFLYRIELQNGKLAGIKYNPACTIITGYSAEEYDRNPGLWMEIIFVTDREKVDENLKKIVRGENVSPIEYRILHKNGQSRWVSDTLIQQFNSQGYLIAYDGVIKDITHRKHAEERLFESKATLATVFDGISDPFIMLDANYRIKRLNRAAKNYYNLESYNDAAGKTCFEGFKARMTPCTGCERPFSELGEFSGSFERQSILYPGQIEKVVVDVVRDLTGIRQASIIRISDITESRLLDRQLIQSEKLASLGLLVAGIAHEINNPNNFIYFNAPILRSYLQFLLQVVDEHMKIKPDEQVFGRSYPDFREDCFRLLDNIEHGSVRINRIVDNLREFVRERGKGTHGEVDVKKVVDKAVSICAGKIKDTVKTFKIDIPESLPIIISDPLALEQILVNLLINAAQAANKEDSYVVLKLKRSGETKDDVLLEIIDNGCGMDEETKKKIFDPFFTTKDIGIGTGLGLSICHRLITELGGRIEVMSTLGKGSTFRVILHGNRK